MKIDKVSNTNISFGQSEQIFSINKHGVTLLENVRCVEKLSHHA